MAHSWGYRSHNGPSYWHRYYPIAGGAHQSPINIRIEETKYDPSLEPLHFNYNGPCTHNIINNGHYISVDFDDSQYRSVLSGGALSGVYRLKQFHFHWGIWDTNGSEHTVGGLTYPAELQLDHWSTKYGSFAEAINHSDGVATVAVFLKIGRENHAFKKIVDTLDLIRTKGKQAFFTDFDPSSLLPSCLDFWTYEGSLTNPPLLECVVWHVLKEPIHISKEQMAKLRSLYFTKEDETPHRMINNFRPPQPLKDRKVWASFCEDPQRSPLDLLLSR